MAKRNVTGMTSSDSRRDGLNGKLVALFGCGDQEDYAEAVSGDALSGTICDIIESRAAPQLWVTGQPQAIILKPLKRLADDDHFVGLAIDEDRQPELTAERVENGCQFRLNLHLDDILNVCSMRRSVISAPHQTRPIKIQICNFRTHPCTMSGCESGGAKICRQNHVLLLISARLAVFISAWQSYNRRII